ncbi:hypothetical protein [Thiohalomonas denitrificans]|uniref:hypothetical protein n=1 Tax=Thiohalomonas denitrificans TaxID=415747 RepID=UPI0026F0961C|nr:hypothetical protein [Thiohalomonas denitrificans]
MNPKEPFLVKYQGYFRNLLKWQDLDRFWERLRASETDWFVYAIGEAPPDRPATKNEFAVFIAEIDSLLRREHKEDYCGIVYIDDPEAPSMAKIYDPNNLGSVCGPGFGPPPLPGWVLSTLPPTDLPAAFPPPENRRRWWRRLFGG